MDYGKLNLVHLFEQQAIVVTRCGWPDAANQPNMHYSNPYG